MYQSIRYALRIATEHEVTSLTIPLLLTLDDVSNNNENNKDYHQWALRRAELVMKWMKGNKNTFLFSVLPNTLLNPPSITSKNRLKYT